MLLSFKRTLNFSSTNFDSSHKVAVLYFREEGDKIRESTLPVNDEDRRVYTEEGDNGINFYCHTNFTDSNGKTQYCGKTSGWFGNTYNQCDSCKRFHPYKWEDERAARRAAEEELLQQEKDDIQKEIDRKIKLKEMNRDSDAAKQRMADIWRKRREEAARKQREAMEQTDTTEQTDGGNKRKRKNKTRNTKKNKRRSKRRSKRRNTKKNTIN